VARDGNKQALKWPAIEEASGPSSGPRLKIAKHVHFERTVTHEPQEFSHRAEIDLWMRKSVSRL